MHIATNYERKRMQPETQISCVHEFEEKAYLRPNHAGTFRTNVLDSTDVRRYNRRHTVVTNRHYLSKLDFQNKVGHLRRLVNWLILLSKEVLPRVGWEMPWRTSV
jgi:hypothetical protein